MMVNREHYGAKEIGLVTVTPGSRPTNDIPIEFEIRPFLEVLWFKMYFTDHNEIMHTSRQSNCRGVCKFTLWSIDHVLNDCTPLFDRISNSIEIPSVGTGPGYVNVPQTARRSHSLLSCICGNAAALPETQLRAAGAAARSQRIQSSNSKYYRQYGSPKAQWTIYWTQVTQQAQPAQPAQLVQLRAANAASASRAPIRSTIGSMGPQKPNEQYIERRWRSRRSQRSWCSCAQPTQPAHPELQFEVL